MEVFVCSGCCGDKDRDCLAFDGKGGNSMPDVMKYSVSEVNIPAVLVANGLGLCLMIAIILAKRKRGRMVSYDGKIFYLMCRLCLGLCALESLTFLLDGQAFAGARALSIFLNAAIFFSSVTMSFLWICYVDFKLLESHERLKRIYPIAAIPAAAICILILVNLFADVFFGVTDANVYYRTPLFWLPYAVVYGYMLYGAILVCLYRKRSNKYLFMPVAAFLIPIFVGSIIQLFCYGLALIFPSVALGLTLIYINLQNEETFLDPLTNLYNRNYLLHYMDHIVKQVQRGKRMTGIMLDINNFKQINDTFGHIAGDGVLRAVGNILLQATECSAVIVRYGGDEFVVLLEDADSETVQNIRVNIARELENYNASGRAPLPISLSAGIAEFNKVDIFEFFQEMDRNMYAEKRAFYMLGEENSEVSIQ